MFFIIEAILGFMFLIVVMGKLIISDGKRYRYKGTLRGFYIKKFFYQTLMLILAFFLFIFMVNQANFIWFLICVGLVVGFYYYMLTLSHNTIPKNRYINLGIMIFCMITIALDKPFIIGYILCLVILGVKVKKAYDEALTKPIYTESHIHTQYKDEPVYGEYHSDNSESDYYFEEEQNNNWGYQAEEEENDFWANDDSSSYEEPEDTRQQFDRMDIAGTDWNSQDLNDIIF